MEKYKTWDHVNQRMPPKDIVIFITGGGSSFGVKSLIDGTVDIGLASRELKDKEKSMLKQYKTFLVGKDAVVIATSKANPIAKVKDDFTKKELADIFSGAQNTYKSINTSLPNQPVVLLVRDSGAGSTEMLQSIIMSDKLISPKALQLPSQGALLKKLETNNSAICYISSGLALDNKNLKIFSLEGVYPSQENVINGSYAFTRPLLMIVKENYGNMAGAFIDYVLEEGQKIVSELNYVPIKNLDNTK